MILAKNRLPPVWMDAEHRIKLPLSVQPALDKSGLANRREEMARSTPVRAMPTVGSIR